MISSASDYKIVTPPDGIVINGDILPARDGTGSARVLRGEDACFLAEAAMRLRRYHVGGSSTVTCDRVPKASLFQSIIPYLHYSWNGHVWPKSMTEKSSASSGSGCKYVLDAASRGAGDLALVNGCLDSESQSVSASWAADASDMQLPLCMDDVRRCYWDLSRNTYTFIDFSNFTPNISAGGTKTSTSYVGPVGDDPGSTTTTTTEYSHYTDLYLAMYSGGNYVQWSSDVFDWSVNTLNPPGGSGNLAGLNPGIKIFINVEAVINGDYHEDMIIFNAGVSNGNISCGISASTIRNMALSARNIPSNPAEMGEGSVKLTCDWIGAAIIDPGIDIVGLNWQWSPT